MRWPWERVPWGRGRGADASDASAGDAAGPASGSAEPGDGSAFRSAPASAPAAWTRLPPLQRSVSDTTAIAPPSAFRSSLTTHQNPSFLAPLGHLVDPEGPGGVVGGLASSVGGPIPYEGVDELRVPDRPARPAAPAVQRRIATLRPDSPVAPEPDVAIPTSDRAGGIADVDSATLTPGHLDVSGAGSGEASAAETPAPAPLVVARLADAPESPQSVQSPQPVQAPQPLQSPQSDLVDSAHEAEPSLSATLGAGGAESIATADPSPIPSAAPFSVSAPVPVPAPERAQVPLPVAVQRTADPAISGPRSTTVARQVGGTTTPATLRPVTPSGAAPPAGPLDELVVARSAAEPAVQRLDRQSAAEVQVERAASAPQPAPEASTPEAAAPEAVAPDPSTPEPLAPEPPTTDAVTTGLLASGPPLVSTTRSDPTEGVPAAPVGGDSTPLTVASGPHQSVGDRPDAAAPVRGPCAHPAGHLHTGPDAPGVLVRLSDRGPGERTDRDRGIHARTRRPGLSTPHRPVRAARRRRRWAGRFTARPGSADAPGSGPDRVRRPPQWFQCGDLRTATSRAGDSAGRRGRLARDRPDVEPGPAARGGTTGGPGRARPAAHGGRTAATRRIRLTGARPSPGPDPAQPHRRPGSPRLAPRRAQERSGGPDDARGAATALRGRGRSERQPDLRSVARRR